MTKNELTVTKSLSTKIENMKPAELEKFAEEKSAEILMKIEESSQRIQTAKDAAEVAANMKAGFFGKTKKKTNAVANGLLLTNEAVAEMNDLIQESIRFTCISTKWAQVMHETMAKMMAKGFKDSNGNIHNLDKESKDFAMSIMEEAENFTRKQLEVERKQQQQDSKIGDINSKLKQKESLDAEQTRRIEQLEGIAKNKDQIDAEQTRRLEELNAILENKNSVDIRQETEISKNTGNINKNAEAIKLLFEYTRQKDELDKQQSEEIDVLKKVKNALPFAIAAFVLSIVSLVISVIQFFI